MSKAQFRNDADLDAINTLSRLANRIQQRTPAEKIRLFGRCLIPRIKLSPPANETPIAPQGE